jgi:pimeloyl-ACP methyl ester carboxylesterase
MTMRGKKISLGFVVFLSLAMVSFHSCMTFRMSRKEIDTYFTRRDIPYQLKHYKSGFRDMYYVQAGDSTKPLVLFLHGSPGSISAFIHFLTDSSLLRRTWMVTADRPGFGFSNYGNAEPSLMKQALSLKPILEANRDRRPIILVGHSLGGPLIAKMAIEFPDLIDGLVIVAGSIDPKLEPNETWFRAPLATPFLSWVLPPSWRSSNEEIYQLKPQLEEMIPQWKNIQCPVVIIHGLKDELVSKDNAEFARKMLVNAPVEFVLVENMNHFVPWSNPELIRAAVLKLASQASPVVGR